MAADSSSEPLSGLKKGAWTEEEDNLLRKCIQKYGEGKWHLVPVRAGLNRCRKSCRLRWLNYLHPNIKRGDFNSDEVDLILRLHKLLGNRWSLIAGRLPGRTANDVKNFWNTRLQKKKFARLSSGGQKWNNVEPPKTTENTVIIRPRPRRFLRTEKTFVIANDVPFQGYTFPPPPPPQTAEVGEVTAEELIGNVQPNNQITSLAPQEETSDDDLTHWLEDFLFDDGMMTCIQQGQTQDCEDFHIDSDLLELLS